MENEHGPNLDEALGTFSNTWTDPEGFEWHFNPTVGDFMRIKRTQGTDFLSGTFPESIYKLIDAAEVILEEQLDLASVALPDLANRIVADPSGFQQAFMGGVQSFFLRSHQPERAAKLMASRIDNPKLNQLIFGKSSSDSQELLASTLADLRFGSFDGCAKEPSPKSSMTPSESDSSVNATNEAEPRNEAREQS